MQYNGEAVLTPLPYFVTGYLLRREKYVTDATEVRPVTETEVGTSCPCPITIFSVDKKQKNR